MVNINYSARLNFALETSWIIDPMKPDQSQPGLTMTAPSAGHWGVGGNYATDMKKVKKIRGRGNISIRICNVRTPKTSW